MRRWMEIWTDSSNSVWYYNREQAPEPRSVFWIAMPTKGQLIEWYNFANNQALYAKLGLYDPGASPPWNDAADCQCGGPGTGPFIPNPDFNYNIIQPYVRFADLVFFASIYPTANLRLFNTITTHPEGDHANQI